MREQTKIIMVIVAVAFVGLMVFEWGMDASGQTGAQAAGGELGRVNGEPVTLDEFNTVYRNLFQQQQQAQDEPISAAMNREIEDAAWQQVVIEKLIEQELRRRDLAVSQAELRQAARFAPPPDFINNELFQTDGRFDLAKYHEFLASPGVDDQLFVQLEGYYREIIPRSKLYNQVTAGIYVSDGELWQYWRDQQETARVRFLALDPSRIVPEGAVAVSDREVAAYYEANRDEFARPAQATVRLATLDRRPSPADTARARERAEQIRAELVGGADFAEVARRESIDEASAAAGGDLGTISRGETVPAFEQAAWSVPVGEFSQPVLTQYGFHIIQVSSRSENSVSARHILVPIELGPEAEDALLERADSLEALGETMTLSQAAQRLGLSVRTVEINEDQTLVPGVGSMTEGVDWAFSDAAPGDVSPVLEAPQAFYLLELVSRREAGRQSLAESKPQIVGKLRSEKRLERARQVARGLVDEIRSGRTLDQVATARSLEVQEAGPFTRLDVVPGLGRLNAAVGAAFGLRPGETSGVVEAGGQLFILQLIDRTEADRELWKAQKEEQRARLTAGLEQLRWARFLESLRDQAEIVDRRPQLLRGTAQS